VWGEECVTYPVLVSLLADVAAGDAVEGGGQRGEEHGYPANDVRVPVCPVSRRLHVL